MADSQVVPNGNAIANGASPNNPFQEEAVSESPVVLSTTSLPPTYNEALRDRESIHHRASGAGTTPPTADERMSLLSSTISYGREGEVSSQHVKQQRGVTRALLLSLGIGQWYSGVCIFICFIFFAVGGVLVVLSVLTLDALQEVKITTVAAGVLFILLSTLWPCAWVLNQWNKSCGCSYAPLIGYTWLLSLLYSGVVGALVFGVNEHYDCIHYCKNCTFTRHQYDPCEFVEMSLWTLVAMVALMVAFLLVCCICCSCRCSCKRESQRSFAPLWNAP